MNELQAAAKGIRAKLAGTAAVTALVSTRIYEGLAPQDASYPLLLFTHNSGSDRNAIGSNPRIFTRPLYVVRAYTHETGSFADADAVAAVMDAALVGSDQTITIGAQSYRVLVR